MIKIVCGLGNPAARYSRSRHNLGFEVVHRLAERLRAAPLESVGAFDFRHAAGDRLEVALVRPLAGMNRSGPAMAGALEFFGASPSELFVISDDFNLALGRLRLRRSGSAGGHKGLQSLIEALGTNIFPRLRIGIGPLSQVAAADPEAVMAFVLSRFAPDEEPIVAEMMERAVEAVLVTLSDGLDRAINVYNRANPAPEA